MTKANEIREKLLKRFDEAMEKEAKLKKSLASMKRQAEELQQAINKTNLELDLLRIVGPLSGASPEEVKILEQAYREGR